MRKFTFLTLAAVTLAALFYLASCTKDNPKTESAKLTKEQTEKLILDRVDQMKRRMENLTTDPQNQSVEDRSSCGKVPIIHNGNSIEVNLSAVPAHLAHGDKLTSCGTFPCIEEGLSYQDAGFSYFYDTDVNNCDPLPYESVFISRHHSFFSADDFTMYGDGYVVWSHNHHTHELCWIEVTEEEYQCARAYLKSIISANPCMPNFCDLHHH